MARWGGHRADKSGDILEVDEGNGNRYLRDFPDNFELVDEKPVVKKFPVADKKAETGPTENKALGAGKDRK